MAELFVHLASLRPKSSVSIQLCQAYPEPVEGLKAEEKSKKSRLISVIREIRG